MESQGSQFNNHTQLYVSLLCIIVFYIILRFFLKKKKKQIYTKSNQNKREWVHQMNISLWTLWIAFNSGKRGKVARARAAGQRMAKSQWNNEWILANLLIWLVFVEELVLSFLWSTYTNGEGVFPSALNRISKAWLYRDLQEGKDSK